MAAALGLLLSFLLLEAPAGATVRGKVAAAALKAAAALLEQWLRGSCHTGAGSQAAAALLSEPACTYGHSDRLSHQCNTDTCDEVMQHRHLCQATHHHASKHHALGGKIMLHTFSLSEEASTCLMMF